MICVYTAFRVFVAVAVHDTPALENAAILGIFPQCIDHFIELHFESVRFQAFPKVKEGGVEPRSAAAEICPKMTDQADLRGDLVALRKAVGMFVCGHGSEFHLHYRSSLRFS